VSRQRHHGPQDVHALISEGDDHGTGRRSS
jgi:hypothetical protein